MLTLLIIALLALIAFAYVALPLLVPSQADPLPDYSDPVLSGLRDERDALYLAIKELEGRSDLPAERREQLRVRYEARAAATLHAIDERNLEVQGKPPPRARTAGSRRVPMTAVVLLALGVATAAILPGYLLPRVGEDATVTTTDVPTATQLRDLQRAAEREPNAENLLALGDMQLSLQQLEEAESTYGRIVDEIEPVPAAAYQRLTVIALNRDVSEAQRWLTLARAADPTDIDTLFLLSEVAYATGDLDLALDALRDFLARAPEEPDPSVLNRLELLEAATELSRAAESEPSATNLLALGDLYWQAGDSRRAVSVYFRLLTEVDATQPVALARTGEAMLVSGSPEDAAALIERAALGAGGLEQLEPSTLIALGNARFQQEQYAEAADAYQTYVDAHDDPGGSVARLLESATALANGESDPHAAEETLLGVSVYAANCAQCHGPSGGGGVGVRLAGNGRAANLANVRDAVAFGRGAMPAFAAQLSERELEAVTFYVTEVLAPGAAMGGGQSAP